MSLNWKNEEMIQRSQSTRRSLIISKASKNSPQRYGTFRPSVSALDLAEILMSKEHKKSTNQKAARFLKSLRISSKKLKRTFSSQKLKLEKKMKSSESSSERMENLQIYATIRKPILKKHEKEIDDIVIWEEDFNRTNTLIAFL